MKQHFCAQSAARCFPDRIHFTRLRVVEFTQPISKNHDWEPPRNLLKCTTYLAAAPWVALASPALAEHPKGPVSFLVPFPPGDVEDVPMRGCTISLDGTPVVIKATLLGKYCGATALTFNMHRSSMMWSQPSSEGGTNGTSKPIQTNCKKVDGGYVINGFKKFASLAGHCDYCSMVCTEHFEGVEPRHEGTPGPPNNP